MFIKWCCDSFKSHYDEAGERGSAILIGRNLFENPEITLQYRAVKVGDEDKINSDVLLSLVVDVGIFFCPWCGRNAEKWYAKYTDNLFRENLKITY